MYAEKYRALFIAAHIINRGIVNFSKIFSSLAIMLIITLITVDVIGRYFFGKPTMIAAEISGYLLVVLVFLGMIYTTDVNKNITVEMMTSRLSEGVRRKLFIVVSIITMIFSGWMAWFTLQPVLMDFMLNTTSLTGTSIHMWIPGALIPFGFLLLSVKMLVQLIIDFGYNRHVGVLSE